MGTSLVPPVGSKHSAVRSRSTAYCLLPTAYWLLTPNMPKTRSVGSSVLLDCGQHAGLAFVTTKKHIMKNAPDGAHVKSRDMVMEQTHSLTLSRMRPILKTAKKNDTTTGRECQGRFWANFRRFLKDPQALVGAARVCYS